MAFWSLESTFEPLRQNRWYISFNGNQDLRWSLKECSKPEYEVSFTEHRLLTQTFKYPGLLKWKPITIKLASTVSEKKTLDNFIESLSRNSGYNSPIEPSASIGNHQQISKNILNSLTLTQIDQDGFDVEEWELRNYFISSVNYGTLSYGSEEIVEITLTIQYDWANQIDKLADFKEEVAQGNSSKREEQIADLLEKENLRITEEELKITSENNDNKKQKQKIDKQEKEKRDIEENAMKRFTGEYDKMSVEQKKQQDKLLQQYLEKGLNKKA